MALSKRRKVDSENRVFDPEWTNSFLFILPTGNTKPVCLICSETVALVKSANVKRHFETKHKDFERTYPLKSEVRSQKIISLRGQYDQSTRILSHTFTAQQRAQECSLRVAWILGQHRKPFTDGGVVKECMSAVAETLLEGKQKQELCEKINQIPMSATSATKKSEILTEDVLIQLDEAMQKAPCVGLAVDESTDICDNAQLLVYVRFFNTDQKAFCEDLLGITPLQTSTRGEDIYTAIKEMLSKRGIEPKKVVSITTDGAPAMIGREKGAVSRLKEDNPELISYHCIIHQSVLCASLSDEHAEVMSTMMKMIHFLRASSSFQHRMLREFLREVDANADELLLHNNVRWLSKGRVLARFWSIRREVASFLAELRSQKASQFSFFLENEKQMDNVAFLVDITSHLNELNLRLQGKNNVICELMTAVRSFQRKLEVFKEDLQGDCEHFPAVQEQLIVNFSNRFDHFRFGQQLTMFIQSPFLITDVRRFSKEVTEHFKWVNAGPLQMQLVDLQADVALKEQCGRIDPSTFWLQMVPETAFPVLRKVAFRVGGISSRLHIALPEEAIQRLDALERKFGEQRPQEESSHALKRVKRAHNVGIAEAVRRLHNSENSPHKYDPQTGNPQLSEFCQQLQSRLEADMRYALTHRQRVRADGIGPEEDSFLEL
ncbi:SCAN domain-containing protein 3-like [Polypterus senegalus]|uniref:SCAN domain-containing protein 3-like n=1 Tax=Polypterus senegalus TaxID=55291 RepID=UPI0019652101|nr:SCAN domain-containing protein 3-like [Polypterus senegalus]